MPIVTFKGKADCFACIEISESYGHHLHEHGVNVDDIDHMTSLCLTTRGMTKRIFRGHNMKVFVGDNHVLDVVPDDYDFSAINTMNIHDKDQWFCVYPYVADLHLLWNVDHFDGGSLDLEKVALDVLGTRICGFNVLYNGIEGQVMEKNSWTRSGWHLVDPSGRSIRLKMRSTTDDRGCDDVDIDMHFPKDDFEQRRP